MKLYKNICVLFVFILYQNVYSQSIPFDKVISTENLSNYLKADAKQYLSGNHISKADLAKYLREKFSELYFYNWENFDNRFSQYKSQYPQKQQTHEELVLDHIGKYPDST